MDSFTTTTQSSARRNKLIALIAGLLVVALGVTFLVVRAGSTFASAEGEQGTVAGGAAVGSDVNASGGKYVQFSNGTSTPVPGGTVDLTDPAKREIAWMLVSTFENTTTNWRDQFAYIEYNVECVDRPAGQRENCGNDDNRGYTGGIIGFTSATGDMLQLVERYKTTAPGNVLEKYIPALRNVNGTPSTAGLGQAFMNDWKTAGKDPKFQQAQEYLRDQIYFNPAINLAKQDGVKTVLGQFAYYDTAVMHGSENDPYYNTDLHDIRANALKKAKSPAQGGDEKAYLSAFFDARVAAMKTEAGHDDTTRVDTAMRKFLNDNNLSLNLPLNWMVYGGSCSINAQGVGAGDCVWN